MRGESMKAAVLLTSSLHLCFRARGSRRMSVVLCATGQKRECSQQNGSYDVSHYSV